MSHQNFALRSMGVSYGYALRSLPSHNNYSHTTRELINCPGGLSQIVKELDGN
jgi:hypothetical protein